MACKIKEAISLVNSKAVDNKDIILGHLNTMLELSSELQELTAITTKAKQAAINEEIAQLREDIQFLEDEKAASTTTDRVGYSKDIKASEARIAKLLKELEILSTIGTRLLDNQLVPRSKVRSKLSDFFKAKHSLSNISLYGNLFKDGFAKAAEIVGFKPEDKAEFELASKRHANVKTLINKFVTDGMDQTPNKAIDTDIAQGGRKLQSVHRLLLTGKAGEYSMPDEVVDVMAAVVVDMFANAEGTRAAVRGDEDTNRLLSRNPEDSLTQADKDRVADIDFLSTTLANSMGAAIYKELGLKADTDAFSEAELVADKMKTELGLFALAALSKAGVIKHESRSPESIYGKSNEGTEFEGIGSIGIVQFTPTAEKLYGRGSTLSRDSRIINKVIGTTSRRKEPVTEVPKDHVVVNKSAMGKFFTVAKESAKALLKAEKVEWVWNEEFMADYLDTVSTESGRNAMKDALGYVDPASVHFSKHLSVNGKNAAIELNMKNMEDWYTDMKSNSKPVMWFKYFFGKNGRFYLDSNVFNPQSIKLHRFAASTGRVALDTDEKVLLHKAGIAQAFGIDVDKITLASTIKQYDALVKQLDALGIEGKSSVEVLQEINDGAIVIDGKVLKPHDPEHGIAGIAEYRRYKSFTDGGKDIAEYESGAVLEVDAVTSGYILKSLQTPLLTNINAALEGGGIFIGEAVKTVTDARRKAIVDAGGEVVKTKTGYVVFEVKSYGTKAENKSKLDAYQTPAKVMTEEIPTILADIKDRSTNDAKGNLYNDAIDRVTELALGGELGSSDNLPAISRGFMKSPFMVFNYGSGIRKILAGVAANSIEELYTMMEDSSKVEQVASIIEASAVGFVFNTESKLWEQDTYSASNVAKMNALAEDYRGMSPGDRLIFPLPKWAEDNIRTTVEAGVGEALAYTFNTVYAPYIQAAKTVNASFSTMFKVFKVRLDKALAAKETELGRRLTVDETDIEINKLSRLMPAISTALSTSEDTSKLLIYDEKAGVYDKAGQQFTIDGQGQVRLTKVDGKEVSISGQVKKYDMVEAMAAGAVIPIHYTDGSAMAASMLATDSLGVHDAKVGTPAEVMTDAKAYNKAIGAISSSYSLTAAILSSFNETLNEATAEEIDAVNASLKKGENSPTVESYYSELSKLHEESETAREKIFSRPIRIEHMALEGSHYDMNLEGRKYKKQGPKVELVSKDKQASKKVQTVVSELGSVNTDRIGEVKPWDVNGTVIWGQRISSKQLPLFKDKSYTVVNNFGNPFMTGDFQSDTGIEYKTAGGANSEASVQYYNWLKSKTVPDNYKGNAELLEQRREWILANLDKVRNATTIHYQGTARGAKVSHINALIKISEEGVNSNASEFTTTPFSSALDDTAQSSAIIPDIKSAEYLTPETTNGLQEDTDKAVNNCKK